MRPRMMPRPPGRATEGGFSLLVILVMMVVLAFIGLGAMNTSVLQERMAGSANDQNIALQAAEAALRDAEQHVQAELTNASPFFPGCQDGLCEPPSMVKEGAVSNPVWETVKWNAASGQTLAYGSHTKASPLPNVAEQPRYIVERLPSLAAESGNSACLGCKTSVERAGVYRITVHATGQRESTEVMLQSVYVKQP